MKTLKYEVSISLPEEQLNKVSPHLMQESLAATARQLLRGQNLIDAAKVVVTESQEVAR